MKHFLLSKLQETYNQLNKFPENDPLMDHPYYDPLMDHPYFYVLISKSHKFRGFIAGFCVL